MMENHTNKIVRINRKKNQSESNAVTGQDNQIIRKKKPVLKLIQKNVMKINDVEPNDVEEVITIEGTEIECPTILKKKTSHVDLSKEEIIEKVEYQKEVLIKNQNKYSEKDYCSKLSTINHLLSKLRIGLIDNNVVEMNEKRVKIDKIVLEKKMPNDQFKHKIDLTGDKDDKDPSMNVVKMGRQYYEDKKSYLPTPKEFEKMDPSKNKNKNFGNQPLPQNLLKSINFA